MVTEQELLYDKYDLIIDKFEELMIENSEVSLIDNLKKVLNEFKFEINTKFIFYLLERILKSWIDMEEDYYSIITCWIIGTYFFENWISYPYIFINAVKRSGKTKLLKLMAFLCKNGLCTTSLTEANLFRLPSQEKCGLFIDEIENINAKEKSSLRELLNSAYKKGNYVVRQRKNSFTEKYSPDKFEVFIPIAMANIHGLEDVLADRCLFIVLERSYNKKIVNRLEWFEKDTTITLFKYLINQNIVVTEVKENMPNIIYTYYLLSSSLSSLSSHINNNLNYFPSHCEDASSQNVINKNINVINENIIFKKLEYNGVIGRDLELWLPLFIIKSIFTQNVDNLIVTASKFVKQRQINDEMEDLDTSFVIFLAKFLIEKEKTAYISYKELADSYNLNEGIDPKNRYAMRSKSISRILNRLKIIMDKKHSRNGNEAMLDKNKIMAKVKALGIEIEPLQSKEVQTTILDQDNSYIDENDQSLEEDSNAI